MQASGVSITCVNIAWGGSAGLPKHFIELWLLHWTVTTTLLCFMTFMDSTYPNNDRLFQQDNALEKLKLSWIYFRRILEIFNEWCGHQLHLTWAETNIYGTQWKLLFEWRILHLQISGSCEQLSKWYSSKSLQRSSNHMQNWCCYTLPNKSGFYMIKVNYSRSSGTLV